MHKMLAPKTQNLKAEQPTSESIFPFLPHDVSLRILALLPFVSYSAVGLVCRAWRDALPSVFATRHRLNLLKPFIVFASQRDEAFQFLLIDPAQRLCREIVRPLPKPSAFPRLDNMALMAAGNEILMAVPYYVFHESFISETMYRFDVQSMQWKDPISLLSIGYSHCGIAALDGYLYASAALDGYLYVAGGQCEISQKAARLDISSKTWEALPDLTEKRVRPSAVVLQGHICIVGGFRGGYSYTKVVDSGEIWDPNTRRWTLIHELWPADIFGEQPCRPCIAVVKDRLYALRPESYGKLQELMYYEDVSRLWISMGKFCFSALVKSKHAFRVFEEQPCQMIGVDDELFVFCCAEPLVGTQPKDAECYIVALYVKPMLSEPLTWGIWPLLYPADYKTQPLISHI